MKAEEINKSMITEGDFKASQILNRRTNCFKKTSLFISDHDDEAYQIDNFIDYLQRYCRWFNTKNGFKVIFS